MTSSEDDEVQRLLDQAAKMRAQIAELEGKSVEQVEEEARSKREAEESRRLRNAEEASKSRSERTPHPSDDGRFLYLPETNEDQVRMASDAIERAFRDGIVRQTVRFALVKEGEPLQEEEAWPGGTKQMYREAGKPLTTKLLEGLRCIGKRVTADDGEDNSQRKRAMLSNRNTVTAQDLWDFDGSALITAEASCGPSGDIQALVFPNTDVRYIDDVGKIDGALGDTRLFLLVNPFWRDVESWSFNILAPNAKQRAQETIFDRGYDTTYELLMFQVRGEQCAALKCYPYDWQISAYLETDYGMMGMPRETPIRLGSSKERPTSAQVLKMLNEREEFAVPKNMRQMKKMF